MKNETAADSYKIIDLPTAAPDPAGFAPYGQLILPREDGAPFGPDDAILDLSQGTPRLYIMRLNHRGMLVTQITRHARVTQCLASTGGGPWFIALAAPSADASAEPDPDQIKGFAIASGTAIKLHAGTWHAGPFFAADTMDFFNLELVDTNETDHQNAYLAKRHGIALRLQTTE